MKRKSKRKKKKRNRKRKRKTKMTRKRKRKRNRTKNRKRKKQIWRGRRWWWGGRQEQGEREGEEEGEEEGEGEEEEYGIYRSKRMSAILRKTYIVWQIYLTVGSQNASPNHQGHNKNTLKTKIHAAFSDFIRFVMIWEGMPVKSAPKLSPRGAKDRQSDPKVTQKGSKGTPKGPQRHSKYTENAPKDAQEVFSWCWYTKFCPEIWIFMEKVTVCDACAADLGTPKS